MVICAQIEMKDERYGALDEFRTALKLGLGRAFRFNDYKEEQRIRYGRDKIPTRKLIIGHTSYPKNGSENPEVLISLHILPEERRGEIKFFTQSTRGLSEAVDAVRKATKLGDLEVTAIPMDVIMLA